MAELSPSQQDAVDCPANSVIIAGPGSGKTRVLSRKISAQIGRSRDYQGVVAISYTNKASDELKGRVQALEHRTKETFFGTIDRFYIGEIVLPFAKYVLGIRGSLPKVEFVTGQEWETLVVRLKGKVEDIHRLKPVPGQYHVTEADLDCFGPVQDLLMRGTIPLSVVSSLAYITLLASARCQRYLRAKYTHVYIDEYQDSDFEQHALFLLLSRLGMVVTAVGDLNQSIFGFAKKDARFLEELRGMEDFRAFYLTDNFRCHPSIQNYAEILLGRGDPSHQEGDQRVFWQHIDGDEQTTAAWIHQVVPTLMERYDIARRSQVAVLARVNSTLSGLVGMLDLPCQLHARLPLSENGTEAGRLTIMAIQYWMGDRSKLFEAQERYLDQNSLRGITLERSRRFHLTRELFCSGRVTQAIAELRGLCGDMHVSGWDSTLEDQLARTLEDPHCRDTFAAIDGESIQLFNLHQSKGLEFDLVLHLDCHDWILPSFDSLKGDQSAMKQDVNLHYVGLTRAKKAVFLLYQSWRHNASGETKKGVRSCFLDTRRLGPHAVQLPTWPPR